MAPEEQPITWDDIDRLGGATADPVMVANFREAGFDEQDALHGAKLMESGQYFGFVDVATSILRPTNIGKGISPVREARIKAVGRWLQEAAKVDSATAAIAEARAAVGATSTFVAGKRVDGQRVNESDATTWEDIDKLGRS